MKLCIIASSDYLSSYGGGQVYVHNIVEEFIRQQKNLDIELTIVSIYHSFGPHAEVKDYQGIKLYEIHPMGDIRGLLQQIAPQVIHANGEKQRIAHICKELNIPCIVTAHHGGICCPAGTLLNTEDKICAIQSSYQHCLPCYLRNIRTGLLWHPIMKHLPQERYIRIGQWLKTKPFIPFISPIGEAALSVQEKSDNWMQLKEDTTHFIAPSYAIANALVRNGANKSKITVIPHGIPFTPTDPRPPHQAGKTIRFYYAGRICHVKGLHVMLKAFAKLANTNIELHIFGAASGKAEIRYQNKLILEYGCDKRIIWHGKVPSAELQQLTQNFDAMIHPAIYLEVFGLDIAEALSRHHYVIATRCGGAEMQIKSETDGMLVPPNNADALAQALADYIADPRHATCSVTAIADHIRALYQLYTRFL